MSRPLISRAHLGVYADRMYGSDILCSRELLSRGQSELQPLLIKHTDWTYSLRSSAPCDLFVRTAGSQNFRNLRFDPEKLAQKSELSLHQMAVRAFFGQQIRAERPSNGCADDLRTKIRAERLSNGYRSQLCSACRSTLVSSLQLSRYYTGLRPETFVCPRVLSLALSYSHSRTESWCLRRRAKSDLLALLAQSQASRGPAPEALSAHLALSLSFELRCNRCTYAGILGSTLFQLTRR